MIVELVMFKMLKVWKQMLVPMNNSAILKANKLRPGVMIGDDDSTTTQKIRQGSFEKCYKLSDTNHNTNFYKELFHLKPAYKELKIKEVIPLLKIIELCKSNF